MQVFPKMSGLKNNQDRKNRKRVLLQKGVKSSVAVPKEPVYILF